jgi:tripeptide aminopeptidase
VNSLQYLINEPVVRKALEFIKCNEVNVIESQIALCEVPAPPFKEGKRAHFLAELFKKLGAQEINIDKVGNVVVRRPGKTSESPVVLAAHIDTVFPEGTDVKVKKLNGIYKGPGIGDDARGLAVLLGVFEALEHNGVETRKDIIFLGDVGEEGLGNLRGVRYFVENNIRPGAFISFDGSGNETICYLALSTYRYKVEYKGPGGHAYNNFGRPSANNVLGRAIAKLADLELPTEPKTILNIGVIEGGSAVNAIAESAQMLIDIRSAEPSILEDVKEKFLSILEEALKEENQREPGALNLNVECLGFRPGGVQSECSEIVRAAVETTEYLGMEPKLEGFKSTTANLPLSLGIPSLTLGSGGYYKGEHSEKEEWDPKESHKSVQRGLLLSLILAGLSNK